MHLAKDMAKVVQIVDGGVPPWLVRGPIKAKNDFRAANLSVIQAHGTSVADWGAEKLRLDKKLNMAKIKTILYCEDDLVVLTLYRKQLQQAGYHVIPAQDGLESMKNLSMFVPDLVILDLMMPKFKGEEVLEYICHNPRLMQVPLIILSASSVVDTGFEQYVERADKHLVKSTCTPAILLETINQILSVHLEEEPVAPAPLKLRMLS